MSLPRASARAPSEGDRCSIVRRLSLVVTAASLIASGGSAEGHTGCHTQRCAKRVHDRHMRQVVAPYRARLLRMAQCESTGRWHIINPPYSGGLQWTSGTWAEAGGHGLAAYASPLEQMWRAVRIFKKRGHWGDWPVCGRR